MRAARRPTAACGKSVRFITCDSGGVKKPRLAVPRIRLLQLADFKPVRAADFLDAFQNADLYSWCDWTSPDVWTPFDRGMAVRRRRRAPSGTAVRTGHSAGDVCERARRSRCPRRRTRPLG